MKCQLIFIQTIAMHSVSTLLHVTAFLLIAVEADFAVCWYVKSNMMHEAFRQFNFEFCPSNTYAEAKILPNVISYELEEEMMRWKAEALLKTREKKRWATQLARTTWVIAQNKDVLDLLLFKTFFFKTSISVGLTWSGILKPFVQ